jgi:hypothetical protein
MPQLQSGCPVTEGHVFQIIIPVVLPAEHAWQYLLLCLQNLFKMFPEVILIPGSPLHFQMTQIPSLANPLYLYRRRYDGLLPGQVLITLFELGSGSHWSFLIHPVRVSLFLVPLLARLVGSNPLGPAQFFFNSLGTILG